MSQATTSPSVAAKNGTASVRGGGGEHHHHHSDKSTLITSLNYNLSHVSGGSNGAASAAASAASNHTYQNISQFKQIQNLLQSTLSNGHNHHNHHHHHGGSHYSNAGNLSSNSQHKMTAPSAVPPPPPPPTQVNGGSQLKAAHVATTNGSGSTSSSSSSAAAVAMAPALAKTKSLDGYVGFANLPNQVYRKAVKRGFEFNLMVIGESGLGKSTFVNSLFLAELYNPADFPCTFERGQKTKKPPTTSIDASTVLLTEKGVSLRLTVVDTPGYGESIDNSNCWQPLVDYVDARYEEYLIAESKINRELPIPDRRVHCCLHFIAPGHTLKQLDVEVMKKLHDRVNLIPIIAKADTMTADEVRQFKANVLAVINEHKLQIYEFPDLDDDDVETNRTNSVLKSKLPFAVVGSNTVVEAPDGRAFRGRQYPWGCVNGTFSFPTAVELRSSIWGV